MYVIFHEMRKKGLMHVQSYLFMENNHILDDLEEHLKISYPKYVHMSLFIPLPQQFAAFILIT